MSASCNDVRVEERRWLRREHYARQNGCCYHCGEAMLTDPQHPRGITIDHIVPRKKGGRTTLQNTVGAHKECNHDRGRWAAAGWNLAKWTPPRFRRPVDARESGMESRESRSLPAVSAEDGQP